MSITIIIVVITSIITYRGLHHPETQQKLIFNPYMVYHRKQAYRLLSHGFIHADFPHALFNLLALWMFGSMVEDAFEYYFKSQGSIYYLMLYVGGIITASLYSLEKHKDNPGYSALGASGAVSAVIFASILLNPLEKIYIFFIPIGIPGWIFGILYLWYSSYMSKKGYDNIGHDAHFWGAIFGLLLTAALRPSFIAEFITQITQSFA